MWLSKSAPAMAGAFLFLVLAACGSDTQTSQANNPQQADAVWPQDTSDLQADPAVLFGKLSNSMRYIILENDTPVGTAAMRLRIDAGSLNERDDQAGLSHFIEHMAFNGSKNVPEGEMIRILERYGLAFGPDTNAFTSFDQIQYQLDLPSTDPAIIDTGFFLMHETAANLTLDAEAIDKERGVIKSEARARNSIGLRSARDTYSFLTPDMPIAKRFPIGEADVIANAPASLFRELYDAYYRPENTTFVMVGDFDAEAMEDLTIETFEDWQGRGAPGQEGDLGKVDGARKLEAHFFTEPDATTQVSISYVRPEEPKPDTAETRKQNQINGLGFRILNRRFDTLARQSDAPFIGAGASSSNSFDTARTVQVSASTTSDNWPAALGAIEQELRRALEHGFTQAEIDEQLANTQTALENQVAQAGTRSTTALAGALAGGVNDTVFTTAASSLARFETYVETITPEMVNAAFKAQWNGRGGPLLQLSDSKPLESAERQIIDIYEASHALPVAPLASRDNRAFAYTDFGPAGRIARDTTIEDLGIRTLQFENNVRLNLKVTDFEDARIRIQTNIGGGELEFAGAEDGVLDLFSSNAFVLGGLEAHSVDELQSLLAGRAVSISFGASADSFGSNVVTTPEDFELQMQLLTAFLTAPGYRQEALGQLHQALESMYVRLSAEPGNVAARDVPRILRSGDNRYGIAPEDAVLSKTMDDIKAIISRALTEGAIEIGIVGDFDEETAIDIISRTFGALPRREPEPRRFEAARNIRFPTDRAPITLFHTGLPDKALAMTYWPTTDDSDQRETYRQRLVRAVFNLKLTDELREELGATYSPNAGSLNASSFPGYGYLSATSNVEPGDVDLVFERVNAIADRMASGGITEDELQRARQPVLENIEESLRNNSAWMSFVSEAQTKPQYVARHRNVAQVYESITVDELTETAAKYLKPENALQIRIISDKTGTSPADQTPAD